jgi:hypothetical protein
VQQLATCWKQKHNSDSTAKRQAHLKCSSSFTFEHRSAVSIAYVLRKYLRVCVCVRERERRDIYLLIECDEIEELLRLKFKLDNGGLATWDTEEGRVTASGSLCCLSWVEFSLRLFGAMRFFILFWLNYESRSF